MQEIYNESNKINNEDGSKLKASLAYPEIRQQSQGVFG